MARESKKNRLPPFVPLLIDTLDSPAWKAMSMGARSLYVALKRRAPKERNRAYLSYRDAANDMGDGAGKTQVGIWFNELEYYGFIVMISPACLGVDKTLREMRSPSDWRRLFRKIEEQQMMMNVLWRHQWDELDGSEGTRQCRPADRPTGSPSSSSASATPKPRTQSGMYVPCIKKMYRCLRQEIGTGIGTAQHGTRRTRRHESIAWAFDFCRNPHHAV